MKLNSIDNMRHDGKFIVNGDIPEGQGSVTALLSECFDLAYELRNEADENKSDDDDGDDNDEDEKGGAADEESDKGIQLAQSTRAPAAESIVVK